MLFAHLCVKMEKNKCVLVFGSLPQALFVLLLQFQAQTGCIFNGLSLAYKMVPRYSALVSEL